MTSRDAQQRKLKLLQGFKQSAEAVLTMPNGEAAQAIILAHAKAAAAAIKAIDEQVKR